jgi:hypothetical protein
MEEERRGKAKGGRGGNRYRFPRANRYLRAGGMRVEFEGCDPVNCPLCKILLRVRGLGGA